MTVVIDTLTGALILMGVLHDTAHLLSPGQPRRPPPTRLRGGRSSLEEANDGWWYCACTAVSTRPSTSTT